MKRIIVLLLVLSITVSAISFTGCSLVTSGGSDGDSASSVDAEATPDESVMATEAEAPTVDPSEMYQKIIEVLETYKEDIGKLYAALLEYLDGKLNGTLTQEDENSIAMDATVLFANDSSELTEEGKSDLQVFMDAYVEAVFTEDNKDNIDTILVEGHTDTNGSHEYNQQLSEKRAKTVMDYCLELHPELKGYMTSQGFSYDRPILNEDGTVNMAASRRVVFSLMEKE